MENFKSNLKKFDLPLFLGVIILSIIGNILVASATNSYAGGKTQVIIQIAATLLGAVMCLVIAFYDYEFMASKWAYIIGIDIFLLVVVLILGIGSEEVGSKSWIRFGPVSVQPSEFVKIGFILSFAYQLSKYRERINEFKIVLMCVLHIGVLVFLLMQQPDFGTTMVFAAIFIVMIFVAGISWKYIVSAVGLIIASFPVLWFFVFKEYQKNRIITFFNPELDTQVSGYHVMQSKTAIGSGQLFGQGLFKGILTQNEFLPAKHTDFIFAVACEELGFFGAAIIIGLIVFIVVRSFMIALKAKDNVGSYIAIGVATMLMVQSLENIGMTIGITPVTGITLPFLSYGGSSMLTNFIAIGLVLNVKIRSKKINFV